jgi:hypothetical protein
MAGYEAKTSPPPPRPRGGQQGNRSAFKHGFYARIFPSSEEKDIETYTFKSLQDEIAALVSFPLCEFCGFA